VVRCNAATPPQLLGNLVDVHAGRQMAVASRYNISPAIDVYVSVQGTDLASVAALRADRRSSPSLASA
ncbi:hypothetical protein, partial [Herbaspirillum sp. B65]|uniref:hypothetical protein n=1 Tax=Herbaspirillum sp. B65 TaxID=137708 RepID=UPI0011D215A8